MSSQADPAALARLLDAFRALGGVADNVAITECPHGLALTLPDPARPARLHVPASLLIPTADTALDTTGALIVRPEAAITAPVKAFFADYQRVAGWQGPGRAQTAAERRRLDALPAALKDALVREAQLSFLFAPDSEADQLARFIHARHIDWQGTPSFMPVMDLVNHDWRAANYGFGEDGLTIAGAFPGGEMNVCYNHLDSWQRLVRYGFASEERHAWSIPLGLKTPAGTLSIGSEAATATMRGGLPFPAASRNADGLVLSHLMLGDRLQPDAPRSIFLALARDHGSGQPILAFERIAHANRLFFLKLLGLAEAGPDDPPETHAAARGFRRLCRLQLEALSFAVGAREIG
jgi:hypothetical protein